MTLNLQHFDTKLRKNLDVQEIIEHSIAEYLFPDTEFALGMVYQEAATVTDLREYQGKTLQFASGERMYFARESVRELLYPNPSDGAAYGSIVFTPNRQFSEQKKVRILIVNDSTGANGEVLPPEVAKKLVGDCYGKISVTLAQKLIQAKNTPFQFRLGIKPQDGNDVNRIAKGTLAPADLSEIGQPLIEKLANGETRTQAGYDLILPTSSFKGRKDKESHAIKPGEYNLTVGIGIKALAEYGQHSLGTQVLGNYPRAVKSEILPQLEEQTKKLAAAQSEPRSLAQLYVDQYERRQEFAGSIPKNKSEIEADLSGLDTAIEEAFGNEEIDSDELHHQDLLLYRLLKADLLGHCQVLEHPKVIDALKKFVRQQWIDNATGRAIKFNSGLAQPSWDLALNEVCVPFLPEGKEVIVTRSPLLNHNGVIVLINKYLPEAQNQQGTIHVHPNTAANHLQADFDGDRLAFQLASKNLDLAAEVKEYNLEQNRYPNVVKPEKIPYSGTFEEIALSAMENKIGLIANLIQRNVALQWETQLIPDEKKPEYLNQISKHYKKLLQDNANPSKDFQLPDQFKQRIEKIANLPQQPNSQQIAQSLDEVKNILFDMVSELSNELQVAVDGPKSAARPNETVLQSSKAIAGYTPVEWLADKKNPEVFLHRPMKSTNYSPIDLMVQQTNQIYASHQLNARSTLEFKPLFQGVNFTQKQEAEAKLITNTYNQLIKQALLLEKKAEQEVGPSLIATSSISGKHIEITHLLKFDPTNSPVWTESKLDIKLYQNDNSSLPSSLKAVVKSDRQGNPWEQTIGIVSPESVEEHNLQAGTKLDQAIVTLVPGATAQQVKAKFKEAAQYLESLRQNTAESKQLTLAAALWSVNHARTENQNNLKKASVAFNAFPEQIVNQLSNLQFTNLTVVGVHQPSNELLGKRWNGERVRAAIAEETDENNPNYGRRIVVVEGKKLAPLGSESPTLPIGTQFEAEIISPPGAAVIATTPKSNSLKVTQIKNYDFADQEWIGQSTQIKLGVAPARNSSFGSTAIAVLIGDKILGILDKESVEKLQAAQLLKPGVTINAYLQTTPSTTASVKVDPKTVEYPYQPAATQSIARTGIADIAHELAQNLTQQQELPFQPPVPDESKWTAVRQYLIEQRRLPESLVSELHRQGMLYADSRQNAVFLQQNLEGTVTGASNSIKLEQQLQELPRSEQREPPSASHTPSTTSGWFTVHRGQGQLERIVLVETPIEAISAAALAKQAGVTLFAALDEAGATSIAWLRQQQTAGVQVLVGYGSYPAGEEMAQQVIEAIPGALRIQPSYGHKDGNEQLVKKVALIQKVEQLSDQEFLGLGQWVAEYLQAAPKRLPSAAEQQQVQKQVEQFDKRLEQLQTQQATLVTQVRQMQKNPLCAWDKNYQDAVIQLQKTLEVIDSTQSQKNQQSNQLQQWAKLAQARSTWEKEPQTTQIRRIAEVLNLPQIHEQLDRIQKGPSEQQKERNQERQERRGPRR